MARHFVGLVCDVKPGGNIVVTVKGRSLGVFNVKGSFYALLNRCPHQGAPLCMGRITGTTLPSKPGQLIWGRQGEIIRCPWHGWEFDITNGRSVFDPHRCRVRAYEVIVAEPEESPGVETFPVIEAEGRLFVEM